MTGVGALSVGIADSAATGAQTHLEVATSLGAARYWGLNNTLASSIGSDTLTPAAPTGTAVFAADAKMGHALDGRTGVPSGAGPAWTFTYTPPTGPTTLEAWAKLSGASIGGSGSGIIGAWDSVGAMIYIANGTTIPRVISHQPGRIDTIAPSGLSTGVWHQIIGVFSTTASTLFIDGTQVAAAGASTAVSVWPLASRRINTYQARTGADRWVNGLIARCVWYPVALTAPQVASLWASA